MRVSRRWASGEGFVHEGDEAGVVVTFQEVGHFVDEEVLEAGGGLFGEFEVKPDAAGLDVAGSPFGLHALDRPVVHGDAE